MGPISVLAVFDSGSALLEAAKAARAGGLSVQDAYSPYPVHGMDQAMGLPPSWLSRACFALGSAGLAGALAFQYWVSLFDWPMNIGGKPFDSSPALVPIAFEVTVLVSGVGTVLALLASRGLYPGRRPRVEGLGATDDKFILVLEGPDEAALRAFLKGRGAADIRRLQGDAQ